MQDMHYSGVCMCVCVYRYRIYDSPASYVTWNDSFYFVDIIRKQENNELITSN